MNLLHQCSKMLQGSLLAMLCACGSGLDRDDGVIPREVDALSTQTTKAVPCATPDAVLDGGTGSVTTDAGTKRPLSTHPNDRCGPAGEGDFPWGPCDTSRGLVCVRPDPEQLDEPPTCQCPEGKVFTEGACAAK